MVIIQICPSIGKECGIARYSEYVANALNAKGHSVTSMARAADVAKLDPKFLKTLDAIIVQHEYGLFDGINQKQAFRATSTSEMLKGLSAIKNTYQIPIYIILHSVNYRSIRLERRTKLILKSDFKVITLSSMCAEILGLRYMEHGIPNLIDKDSSKEATLLANDSSKNITPRIVHFSGISKRVTREHLIELSNSLEMPLDVNFFEVNPKLKSWIKKKLAKSHLDHKITFGFISEADMIKRWRGIFGVFVNPQEDLRELYNTSGSTRLAYNFGMPIVCTGKIQHLDLDAVISVSNFELVDGILKALANYEAIKIKIYKEMKEKSLVNIYEELLNG